MPKVEGAEAYPLYWPEGWPRTHAHLRDDGSRFKTGSAYQSDGAGGTRFIGKGMITFDRARRQLSDELDRLKAKSVVLSTNVPLRLDGQPKAGEVRASMDPGVAIYFLLKGKPMVMACDGFTNVAANLRSLGLAIEALRTLERHGGGVMMERAFAGFAALPAPAGSAPKRAWWVVLNYGEDPEARLDLSVDEVEARFRTLAKRRHPDVDGGSAELMAELNEARADAVRELGG